MLSEHDSVQFLKGVGPARTPLLAELGIRTVGDLLHYFPRDLSYQPAREPIAAARKQIGQNVTLGGWLERVRWRGRWGRQILSARLADDSGWIEVVFFNAAWLRDRLGEGDRVVMTGKLRRGRSGAQLANPKFQVVADEPAASADRPADPNAQLADRWEPVYPASAAISSNQIRTIVRRNLARMLDLVRDPFAPADLRRRGLIGRRQAVAWMHLPAADPARPTDGETLIEQAELSADQIAARRADARRRLAWDEAFLFQLALALHRRDRQHRFAAPALPCSDEVRRRILRRFPFTLTRAQDKAIAQIAADLAQPVPMSRLLQGDVGSGKTVVALFAALVAVANRRQAAIMAPTELLARQHHERIGQYLSPSRVRAALLTGSLGAADRRRLHRALAAGQLDLVVGTTALISDPVRFADLGLIVIDEQHKFGVYQRTALRERGRSAPAAAPHVLVMTATPIPRSLALTVFGDLAVSALDESPPGRGRIDTRVVGPANREQAFEFIGQRLARGGSVYVVCPRIGGEEETSSEPAAEAAGLVASSEIAPNPSVPIATADETFRDLSARFGRFGAALVHGRMDRDRQQRALADFAAGRCRVLVATTVVEVGVDVARANVMAVLSAERFGLAQLHQLRGRIGRSADAGRSYCLLFTDAAGPAADRLAVLEQTRDGFRIAEEDLARRGPGQFFGPAQHGLPEFKLVNLAEDFALIQAARQDAFALVAADPTLADHRHATLRDLLAKTCGEAIKLLGAG